MSYVTENIVYGKKSFRSTESDTKILHSIYFAYKVGNISSYLNRIGKHIRWTQKKVEKGQYINQ